ncbi:serine/threonine-protein kinase [Gimesia algae]|uniref:non-specific serine/threonine protein kinase n=1 Tax=Gimesia algae TaxID=2527971 RepID=A0A517V6G0_9PLAN|nr:serine/threonine-protein kinase [Gimesia algae]QDT88584.1 Serine/threonine-protein kinase PrkC [Gimesia algae]
MVARFHFDVTTLERYLRDQLDDQQQSALIEHVESCEVCLEQIDTLSRQGLSWDDVGEMLRDDELSEFALSADYPGIRPQEDDQTDLLEPTERDDSLGRFARYEILEFLGRGGMGIVLRGLDTALDRQCAIKVLSPRFASSAAARKRFSREAKSAAAVVHPHVVPILTVNEHNGLPYLVMPVVEGKSLQRRIEKYGPLSVIESIRIAAQVADGLSAAHVQGLVHRDIKPENILLENGVERVQITDFGLARAVDDASMTRSGVIAGTPQYMSPEQAHGDSIDHRSDLFSLGSVMYFMLAGRSPFRAETTMGVLNRIGKDTPRSLRSINADVPFWLEEIVTKLLEKPREDRFQSAEEISGLLNQWLAHLQTPDSVPMPVRALPSEGKNSTVLIRKASRPANNQRWLIAGSLSLILLITLIILLIGKVLTPTSVQHQPANETLPAREQDPATQETPGIAEGTGWNSGPSLQDTSNLLDYSDALSQDADRPFQSRPVPDTAKQD